MARISEIPELKKNTCLTTYNDIEIFDKYSSYSNLLRIVAYCFRFLPTTKHNEPLIAEEINKAEIRVLKLLQAVQFPNEIKRLNDKFSTSKGKFANLNPFLDQNGLIRVGGFKS